MGCQNIAFLRRLAKGLVEHFGNHCEVVIHDLKSDDLQDTIVTIENGHVTNRKVGDGASNIVLESKKGSQPNLEDVIGYMTKTQDGRLLKSSSIYINDEEGNPEYIFCINYDMTQLSIAEGAIKSIINLKEDEELTSEAEQIPTNVNNLLDSLIKKSVERIGKPVALMTKEDKIRCMEFLNEAGAFLITKSGDKISKYFGISKYSIYNYVDIKR